MNSTTLSDEKEEIADWLERLTENRQTWGFDLKLFYLREMLSSGQDPLIGLMLGCRHNSRTPMIWGTDEQFLLADRSADGATSTILSKEPGSSAR